MPGVSPVACHILGCLISSLAIYYEALNGRSFPVHIYDPSGQTSTIEALRVVVL